MLDWLRAALFDKHSSANLQLDSLDGLRGLAVLFVLLSHLSNVGFGIPGVDLGGTGAYGVYLFFTLSAFLLTLPMLGWSTDDAMQPGPWLAYALRRVLRIFPLYFAVLALHHGLHDGLLEGYLREMDRASFIRHLTLREGISVYWTIPVEFKYYLVLPAVALFYAWVLRSKVVPVLVATALALAAAIAIWPPELSESRPLDLGAFLPVFLMGSVAACLHRSIAALPTPLARGTRNVFELAAWAALIGVLLHTPSFWGALSGQELRLSHFHRDYLRFGLLWSVLLVGQLHGRGWLRAVLASKGLRAIGIVSFSLYLIHVPMMRLIGRALEGGPGWLTGLCISAAAIGLATASYLVVERPFTQSQWIRNLVGRAGRVRRSNRQEE